MNNLQITSRIKLLCKEKNISVTQLLSDCGFAKSFVYDLEKRDNSPSCDRISKIADLLECSVDYLLGRIDEPTPKADSSIHAGNISGDNNSSTGNNFNIGTKTSAVGEQQQEISEMLSDMSPRERNKLMSMIYDFHDECKKGNEECDHI